MHLSGSGVKNGGNMEKSGDTGAAGSERVDFYGAAYGNFASVLYGDIRRAAFGEDLGQNSWLTAGELETFLDWLKPGPGTRLIDIACGSGGPALRIARLTGCEILGVDIEEKAIAVAREQALTSGLSERAWFDRVDAGQSLPFQAGSFDALICIDAINHLPDRVHVLADWARVLKSGGRLLFTDPIVVTGPLSNDEIAVRSSIGYFLFAPPGEDERLIEAAGLELLRKEDVTKNMAEVAGRWGAARAARAEDLRRIEGVTTFEGQQEFFRVAERVARERRLSRFVYVAKKPA
jgi:SAM-dependent methyltransferase